MNYITYMALMGYATTKDAKDPSQTPFRYNDPSAPCRKPTSEANKLKGSKHELTYAADLPVNFTW